MRSLLLEIGPVGEIEGAAILAETDTDEHIAQGVLDQILEKKDPGRSVGKRGPRPGRPLRRLFSDYFQKIIDTILCP